MRICLYRASAGNWLDTGIDLWSRLSSKGSGYSHAELWFPPGVSVNWQMGACFSSTTRGDMVSRDDDGRLRKTGGTRFKFIDFDPGKWAIYEVPATKIETMEVYAWCAAHLGRRYDYEGIFGFLSPLRSMGLIRRHNPDKWFCSEVVVRALQQIPGLFRDVRPEKTSPNELDVLCRAAGLQRVA